MADYCDEYVEREPATEITVRRFDGEKPGTAQAGMTRRAGVLATGVPNPREREQATFRGKELMRRANNR
jgi:hypothetical protein